MTQEKKAELISEMEAMIRRFEVILELLKENPEEVYTEEEPEPVVKISDVDLEIMVTEHIRMLGVPAHIKGNTYAKDVVLQGLKDKDSLSSITKILYPTIARKNHTTASRVERAIRTAIEIAWTRGDLDFQQKIFGYTTSTSKGKPTNAEFILTVTDYIALELKKQGFTL